MHPQGYLERIRTRMICRAESLAIKISSRFRRSQSQRLKQSRLRKARLRLNSQLSRLLQKSLKLFTKKSKYCRLYLNGKVSLESKSFPLRRPRMRLSKSTVTCGTNNSSSLKIRQ